MTAHVNIRHGQSKTEIEMRYQVITLPPHFLLQFSVPNPSGPQRSTLRPVERTMLKMLRINLVPRLIFSYLMIYSVGFGSFSWNSWSETSSAALWSGSPSTHITLNRQDIMLFEIEGIHERLLPVLVCYIESCHFLSIVVLAPSKYVSLKHQL